MELALGTLQRAPCLDPRRHVHCAGENALDPAECVPEWGVAGVEETLLPEAVGPEISDGALDQGDRLTGPVDALHQLEQPLALQVGEGIAQPPAQHRALGELLCPWRDEVDDQYPDHGTVVGH